MARPIPPTPEDLAATKRLEYLARHPPAHARELMDAHVEQFHEAFKREMQDERKSPEMVVYGAYYPDSPLVQQSRVPIPTGDPVVDEPHTCFVCQLPILVSPRMKERMEEIMRSTPVPVYVQYGCLLCSLVLSAIMGADVTIAESHTEKETS